MEANFGPLEKWTKKIDKNGDEIFHNNSRLHPFWPQEEWRNFGRVERRTSWRDNKKDTNQMATICNRMNGNRMAQIMLHYRPDGRRWLGRHLKGMLDQAETGLSRLNWWLMMMMMMMIIRAVCYKSRPQNWTIFCGTDWTNENCSQPNDNEHDSLSAECDTWPGRRTDSEGEAQYCWHLWEIWSPIRIHVTSSR